MARFTGSKGKVVRRLGVNVFGHPKFDRLLAKRSEASPRGGARRSKVSDYGQQLAEKQKLKYTYGLRERQFRATFQRALRMKGVTGDTLLVLLETRLDNVVYRLGMAATRDAARQLVGHGHVKVNGRRVNIPSFQVRANDIVSVKDASKSQAMVRKNLEENISRDVPGWLQMDRDSLKGSVLRVPMREEIPSVANEKMVVELYSK